MDLSISPLVFDGVFSQHLRPLSFPHRQAQTPRLMFAALRHRCSPLSAPVSLRRATAWGLLVTLLHPACSADRFNSTDNAAAPGAGPDDYTSAATEPSSNAKRSYDSSGSSGHPDAGTPRESMDGAVSITSDPSTRAPVSGGTSYATTEPAASSGETVETALSSTESTTPTDSAPTQSASSSNDTLGSSRPPVDPDSTEDATSVEGGSTRSFPPFDLSSAASDAGVDASVSTDVGEFSTGSPDDTDAATTDDYTQTLEPVEDATGSSQGQSSTTDASTGETGAPLPVVCSVTRTLPGIVRDFSEDHPDMEPCDEVECRAEKGLLEPTLGGDGKPVLAAARSESSTVRSAETFNQWFNDVPGVNTAVSFPLRITTQRVIPLPQRIGFDSANPPPGSPAGFSVAPRGFFPIDELNTTTRPHNYSFTYEVTSFIEYRGGETLTVRGDDDIFVFIDRRLVIDLGGIHLPQEATVNLDTLGLERGRVYDFRIFFAERHVEQSNLYLSTTARFMDCTSD